LGIVALTNHPAPVRADHEALACHLATSEELEGIGAPVGHVDPVGALRGGADRCQASHPQQAFAIGPLAFLLNAFLATHMAAAVQDLIHQADDLVPLRIESQAVVAQETPVEATANRPKVGDRAQPRIIQFGGIVQHQLYSLGLPQLGERTLTVRLQHRGVGHLGPVHQAVHGLVVLGVVQLGGQRTAGVAIDLVRNPYQALAPSLVSQSRPIKMGLTEASDGCPHDCPPQRNMEAHRTSSISGRSRCARPVRGPVQKIPLPSLRRFSWESRKHTPACRLGSHQTFHGKLDNPVLK
jgi:hypothetical protein